MLYRNSYKEFFEYTDLFKSDDDKEAMASIQNPFNYSTRRCSNDCDIFGQLSSNYEVEWKIDSSEFNQIGLPAANDNKDHFFLDNSYKMDEFKENER